MDIRRLCGDGFAQASAEIVAYRRSNGYRAIDPSVPCRSAGQSILPGDDVARGVVEHSRQVVPAPADDLEASEIGLPGLVDPPGQVFEAVTGGQEDMGQAGAQVISLEDAIDARFREEIALAIGDQASQLPLR